MDDPSRARPPAAIVFIDYQCPYSHRVVEWLETLGPGRIAPTYRMFGLEQVNRDAAATDWRLWDQPLDYEHHRGRPDRRSLPAFLATALVEAAYPPGPARSFRLAVYRARFEDGADISDRAVLRAAAERAGTEPDRADPWAASPDRLVEARSRLAADWAEARRDYAVFGVPTLWFGRERPWYLRLERTPRDAEGVELLDRLVALRTTAPYLLELKVPEPTPA